jgi:Chitobiase/beta-hexosaminidase C-terminal domain
MSGSGMKIRSRSRTIAAVLAMALLVQQFATQQDTATAGIYEEASATAYEEVWVPHSSYKGRLLDDTDAAYVPGGAACQWITPGGGEYYIEPEQGCDAVMPFTLPANLGSATKVDMFLDLWRGHDNSGTIQYKFNNDSSWTTVSPSFDWSRSTKLITLDMSRLDPGANTIKVRAQSATRKFHVNDVAFRIYGLAGSYPSGAGLTTVSAGGSNYAANSPATLDLSSSEQITLSATVANADAVEFIAYYDGFDENNDGNRLDWHAFSHNNCNDGTGSNTGVRPSDCQRTFGDTDPVSATMGHAGTDLNDGDDTYSVTWDTSLIASQSGVKFKVRAIDASGNKREVVDALGGESANYTLDRGTEVVEYFTSSSFEDGGLCQSREKDGNGDTICKQPTEYSVNLTLPADISDITSATLLGNFWQAPFVTVNSGAKRLTFDNNTSVWTTSELTIPVSELQPGVNTIKYEYNPARIAYGQFIESPGPMLVVRRPNAPRITGQPQSMAALYGQTANFSVAATGSGLTYQWRENGAAMGGETSSSLSVTASNTPGDTSYSVIVSAGGTDETSEDAILTVVDVPLTSDQFDSTTKKPFWAENTYQNRGDFDYTGEQLIITVPESNVDLQPWTSGNRAPTLVQTALNTDMDLIMGIENLPLVRYQLAGAVVAGVGNEFLRFDIFNDGTPDKLKVHRNYFSNGSVGDSKSVEIDRPPGNKVQLRISRVGDDWKVYTSADGATWNAIPGLDWTRAITVDQVGPFAGNVKPNAGALAPAYSAVFDYFFAELGDSEGAENDSIDPVISFTKAANLVVGPTAMNIDWSSAEPTVSHVEWRKSGTGSTYPNDEGTGALGKSEAAVVSGLEVNTSYDFKITAIDHNGNTDTKTFSATTSAAGTGATIFDAWYTDSQSFGLLGNPQRWVNIVGNVSDAQGITKLEYKVNGGPYKTLNVGPDDRRLPGIGDFNADILGSTLGVGSNTIKLRATDGQGNKSTYDIQVQWGDTAVWDLPYAVDWGGINSPTDGLQIIDGNWVLENDTVTLGNLDVGYDRLAVIGDATWGSYEALVPVTVNAIAPDGGNDPKSFGPGVGVMMHWNGHNDDPSVSGEQPLFGFKPNNGADPTPLGSILWWRDPANVNKPTGLQVTDNRAVTQASDTSFNLELGTQYLIRTRAEVKATGVTYSMKMWKASTTEPSAWTLTYTAGIDDFEPQSGALILVSHEVDASYGSVIVTPAGASKAAAPTYSVASGIVDVDDEISLSSATPGATIYYTVDGSEPSPLSAKYTGPFVATADLSVKAIAYADEFDPSNVASASYTVNLAPEVTTGAAVTVEVNKTAALKSTVTDDGVTGSLSLKWTKKSGPGNVSFSSSTSANTNATFSAVGTYVVEMTANDGRLIDSATLSVVVSATTPPAVTQQGYWMLEADGDIYGFGDSAAFSTLGLSGRTAVGFDASADGNALWLLDSAGQIHTRGTAKHFGNVDPASLAAGEKVASISATPSGNGYWVFTDRGRALVFGDASHFSDLPTLGITPVGAVVASAPTPSGNGYYMLGSDGGVFAFGDANFVGSIPQVLPPGALACPIVGLVPVPAGDGYWMVACDGGVFAFGNAPFVGSIPGVLPAGTFLNAPINGMVPYGNGYLMVASDGGVFTFSNLEFLGSLGGSEQNSAINAITAFAAS